MGIELLRKIQKDGRWKNREVAKAIGVSETKYSFLINGKQKPSVELMVKLARFFEMDFHTFNLVFFNGKLPFAQSVTPEE